MIITGVFTTIFSFQMMMSTASMANAISLTIFFAIVRALYYIGKSMVSFWLFINNFSTKYSTLLFQYYFEHFPAEHFSALYLINTIPCGLANFVTDPIYSGWVIPSTCEDESGNERPCTIDDQNWPQGKKFDFKALSTKQLFPIRGLIFGNHCVSTSTTIIFYILNHETTLDIFSQRSTSNYVDCNKRTISDVSLPLFTAKETCYRSRKTSLRRSWQLGNCASGIGFKFFFAKPYTCESVI